jgi:hypothetical protein
MRRYGAHDPAGAYDEALAIYVAILFLEPVPSSHGYVRPALENLLWALRARGYTLGPPNTPSPLPLPTLVPWEPD